MSYYQRTYKTGSSAEKKSSSSKTSTTPSPSRPQYPQGIHNARNYIMHLQRTIGNQAVGRLLKSGWLQRKLNIGPANDKYEQEADAVAEKVVSMNEPQAGSNNAMGNSPSGETQRISRTPLADSITPLQRSAQAEEDDVQKVPTEEEDVQKASTKDEEELKGKFLQRKCTSCEKEEAQAKFVQRKASTEEEDIQKAPVKEDEELKGKFLQREAVPEEEDKPTQGKVLDRKISTPAFQMQRDYFDAVAKKNKRQTSVPPDHFLRNKQNQAKSTKDSSAFQMQRDYFDAVAKNNKRQTSVSPDHFLRNKQNQAKPTKDSSAFQMQRDYFDAVAKKNQRQTSVPPDHFLRKKQHQLESVVAPPGTSTSLSAGVESSINATRGGGRSLSPGERSYYEPRFGTSFEGVKIHTDSKAAQLSRSVNARAFTVGRDVFFGAGEYSPNTIQGKKLIAHELTHTVQQGGGGNGNIRLQRWIAPTDWLDYIGLAVDVGERIYIELSYEEGQEKDYKRFINNLYFAIDLILAALPGAGGGGLAFRASHKLAVAGWGAIPTTAKIKVSKEVAKQMGWSLSKATQMINIYFNVSQNKGQGDHKDKGERRTVDTHEQAGGHTQREHVGKSESWLRNRLKNHPKLKDASSFFNKEQANRVQGSFVKLYRKEIAAWLKSGKGTFTKEIRMKNVIGIVLTRGKAKTVETTKALFVLARDKSAQGWHFVTSYPIK